MSEQTIYDEILGELAWNNEDECWSSQVEISPEHFVNVTIDPDDSETGAVILFARQYFTKLQQEEINIRGQISKEMLPLYNNTWSNGEEIDRENFIDSLKLEDIVFYANGNVELFYNDGGLFDGHMILAAINPDGNYQGASLIN